MDRLLNYFMDYFTPTKHARGTEAWDEAVFVDAGLSPPKRSPKKRKREIQVAVDRFKIDIDTLTPSGKGKVLYMLGLGFDEILRDLTEANDETIKELVLGAAADSTKEPYQRLEKLVATKGGDKVLSSYPEDLDLFANFLNKHPKWGGQQAKTIFTVNKNVEPAYRFQETSTCYLTAVASMITYLNASLFPSGDVLKNTMNISRHTRNTMDEVAVCQLVFQDTARKSWVGGDSEKVLKELVMKKDSLNFVSVGLTRPTVRRTLFRGFVVSHDFAYTDRTEFFGTVQFSRRKDAANRQKIVGLHALLLVGKLDDGSSKTHYLLQNSFKTKQWLVVDFDYLKSMDEFNLSEKTLLKFITPTIYTPVVDPHNDLFDEATKALECVSTSRSSESSPAILTEALFGVQDMPIPTAVSSSIHRHTAADHYYWIHTNPDNALKTDR